jgi:hypothetical protein
MNTAGRDMAKVVRIFCAIALLCLGFAHRAPAVATAIPAGDLWAYTLPDGTVPVLCLPEHHGDASHHDPDQHPAPGCEACRLDASTLLPTPADIAGISLWTKQAAPVIPLNDHIGPRVLSANTLARGPPRDRLA